MTRRPTNITKGSLTETRRQQDNLKAAKKAAVKPTGITNNTKADFGDETQLFIAF
jgi:hypothetical protein